MTDRYVISNRLDAVRGRIAFSAVSSAVFSISFIAFGFESISDVWTRVWVVLTGSIMSVAMGWWLSKEGTRELGGTWDSSRHSRSAVGIFGVAGAFALSAIASDEVILLLVLVMSLFLWASAGSSVACYVHLKRALPPDPWKS